MTWRTDDDQNKAPSSQWWVRDGVRQPIVSDAERAELLEPMWWRTAWLWIAVLASAINLAVAVTVLWLSVSGHC